MKMSNLYIAKGLTLLSLGSNLMKLPSLLEFYHKVLSSLTN